MVAVLMPTLILQVVIIMVGVLVYQRSLREAKSSGTVGDGLEYLARLLACLRTYVPTYFLPASSTWHACLLTYLFRPRVP